MQHACGVAPLHRLALRREHRRHREVRAALRDALVTVPPLDRDRLWNRVPHAVVPDALDRELGLGAQVLAHADEDQPPPVLRHAEEVRRHLAPLHAIAGRLHLAKDLVEDSDRDAAPHAGHVLHHEGAGPQLAHQAHELERQPLDHSVPPPAARPGRRERLAGRAADDQVDRVRWETGRGDHVAGRDVMHVAPIEVARVVRLVRPPRPLVHLVGPDHVDARLAEAPVEAAAPGEQAALGHGDAEGRRRRVRREAAHAMEGRGEGRERARSEEDRGNAGGAVRARARETARPPARSDRGGRELPADYPTPENTRPEVRGSCSRIRHSRRPGGAARGAPRRAPRGQAAARRGQDQGPRRAAAGAGRGDRHRAPDGDAPAHVLVGREEEPRGGDAVQTQRGDGGDGQGRVHQGRERRLVGDEEQRLLAKAQPHLRDVIVALLDTGCRIANCSRSTGRT